MTRGRTLGKGIVIRLYLNSYVSITAAEFVKTRNTDHGILTAQAELQMESLPVPTGTFVSAFGVTIVAIFLARYFFKRCFHALDKDEQLLVVRLTDSIAINGPGINIVSPFVKSVTRRKAELLEPLDFLKVKDTLSGELAVVKGPCLHFLGAFDRVEETGTAYSLTAQEYVIVKDTRSGAKRVETGPAVYVPGAYEVCSGKQTAYSLSSDQFCRLRDRATGERWTVKGPSLMKLEPTWELIGGVESAISLRRTEYVRLIDETSGAIRVERGETMVFPEATERVLDEDGGKVTAINLKVFQYIKILDNATGVLRVVRGEATVFLGPTESVLGKGKTDAVRIHELERGTRTRDRRLR